MGARKGSALAKGFDLPTPPKRTDIPEGTARKFEKATEIKSKEGSSSMLRRDSCGERVSVYLPPEMVTQLRMRCAVERRSISNAVTEAVRVWLTN